MGGLLCWLLSFLGGLPRVVVQGERQQGSSHLVGVPSGITASQVQVQASLRVRQQTTMRHARNNATSLTASHETTHNLYAKIALPCSGL